MVALLPNGVEEIPAEVLGHLLEDGSRRGDEFLSVNR
jgi:hypothetical protein